MSKGLGLLRRKIVRNPMKTVSLFALGTLIVGRVSFLGLFHVRKELHVHASAAVPGSL